jgi:hypothetical protein
LPKLERRVLSSSLVRYPSLFTSDASNCSLSLASYSFVSFFSKWPAEAALRNSCQSNFPSLLTSMLFKNEATSTSLPKLARRVLSSSFVRYPSLLTSDASNRSLSLATYSLVSFLLKWPAEAAEINSWKSSFPSLFTSTLLRKELTSISFPRLAKRTLSSSFDR